MFFNGLLHRIMRGIVVFTIAFSLFFGDILLSSNIALAGPLQFERTVIGNILSTVKGDPFDRDGDPAGVGQEFRPPIALEDCFWQTTVGGDPFFNAYYTDAQAYYPSAVFSVEPGGYVEVKGEFPHARSFTLTAYHYDGDVPTLVGSSHQLQDFEIQADDGSTNPFDGDGADRTTENRSYTLKWVPEALPDNPFVDALAETPNEF